MRCSDLQRRELGRLGWSSFQPPPRLKCYQESDLEKKSKEAVHIEFADAHSQDPLRRIEKPPTIFIGPCAKLRVFPRDTAFLQRERQ